MPTRTRDADGVVRIDRGGLRLGWLAAALLALAVGGLLLALRPETSGRRATSSPDEPRAASRPAVVVDVPPAPAPLAPGEELFIHQVPPGDGTGIHAFPKPGTKPIKTGIIVPEGYELPPGYVAHHQATDDGDEVPPILMFHPDYHPVDAQGRPIPLPADRIVPPEMAPAGMPIQLLPPHPVRADLDENGRPLQ